MENISVADIMTRIPITIKPDVNVLECAKKMVKKRVGSLLIADKKKLVGFISEKDILWALVKKSKNDLSKIKAVDISPKKIVVLRPTATIEEVIKKIKKSKFYRFPVIQNGELVGMITLKDILNFYPQLHHELSELEFIREEKEKLKRLKKSGIQIGGICEECGNHDYLHKIDGRLICESCKDSM